MAPLIHEDFLLETPQARRLYHEVAKALPIIDYHCHISPEQIAADHRFGDLFEIWLAGDHYKWRAMRTNGVDERYCTGDADAYEKFEKWAETVPATLRNPLFHWTHLELKHPFGITDRLLGPKTARSVWEECNEKLARPEFSTRGLIRYFNVACICTTDDPVDSLEPHRHIAEAEDFDVKVLPAWRPDKAMAIDNVKAWGAYVDRLSAAADVDITDFDSFMRALNIRHEFFHARGCRLSDHGLERIDAAETTPSEVAGIFARALAGHALDALETSKFKSAMLYEFGLMDAEKGWAQQYHLGAMRNNNTQQFEMLGPDTGFDSIGDWGQARPLATLLDRLDRAESLAPTILYNLNPADNAAFATMIGNFQDGSRPGKMQWGAGWWFNDQLEGMTEQINILSQMGLLARFVGMLTDSRSFLSYTRHEYFRRLLCNILGDDMRRDLIPDDHEMIAPLVRDICFNNAARYFDFGIAPLD